jgi:prepilin-type N-terminal cleavage/methylation domain-containing protein
MFYHKKNASKGFTPAPIVLTSGDARRAYTPRKQLVRGFTLIEISVVMSIIAIMSVVITINIMSARKKGDDADIKGSLATIQSRAEIYYDLNKNYSYETDSCGFQLFSDHPTDGDIIIYQAYLSARKASGFDGLCVARDASPTGSGSPAKSYAVAVRLKQDTTKWRCVDSSGFATTTNGTPDLTTGVAPAEMAKCP